MSSHNCHFNSAGQLKCWGSNIRGQLGLGIGTDQNIGDSYFEMGNYLAFVDTGDGYLVDQVALGYRHTCVHFTSNQTKCWGSNDDGQLALGLSLDPVGDSNFEKPNFIPPSNLGSDSYPTYVVCGHSHSCFLFANKKVKCVGSNFFGQLGYVGVTSSIGKSSADMGDNLPYLNLGTGVLVESLYSFGESYLNCVIVSTSQLMKCWGTGAYNHNGYGNANDFGKASGTMGDNLPYVDLGAVSTVKQISIANYDACALRTDDELKCWGKNTYGDIGIGSTNYINTMGSSLVSTPYDAGKKIKHIVGGMESMCVLFDDDVTVKCVGDGSYGQLGQGYPDGFGGDSSTTIDKIPAVDLGTGNKKISYLRALDHAYCAIYEDNKMKCFGNPASGKLGYENLQYVGTDSSNMGTNLAFVYIFATNSPTSPPSVLPTSAPTNSPTKAPSKTPTKTPTTSPSKSPTPPTFVPTKNPTKTPSIAPTKSPVPPTRSPTKSPAPPSRSPTKSPTSPSTTKSPTPMNGSASSLQVNALSVVSIFVGLLLITINH